MSDPLSALVKGPNGEKASVKFASKPPTDDAEMELLKEWVHQVLEHVGEVANSSSSTIHLYCYSSYDQSVLLKALKRHLAEVSAFPAFFDIMTQSPALNQPIISFLSDELRDGLT